jgi:thiol-disulfide isomerase/thioredoxin
LIAYGVSPPDIDRALRPQSMQIKIAAMKMSLMFQLFSSLPRLARALLLAMFALGLVASISACSSSQVAPESTFVLLDGSKISTSDFKGKVTLVNFWATSCVTCVAEMPKLIATHQKYVTQGFDTVAVAMSYDPPSYVVNYTETRQLPFKVAIDNTGSVAKAWGDVALTPTTYLLNKRGEIVKQYVGEPDFAALHQLIEKLLAQT